MAEARTHVRVHVAAAQILRSQEWTTKAVKEREGDEGSAERRRRHRRRLFRPLVRRADIVVGAVGKPEFIRAEWIKDGAVVVDAGYHPGGVGDIELAPLLDRVSAYTPVPGGVGPMTINTLIYQSVHSAEQKVG